MNQYQYVPSCAEWIPPLQTMLLIRSIYEKIGKGKHSTVYKGRKKKTIQYHAIKSVDKSQKPRVLQEVRTMHALDHRNILKFYAWYETTNHLWLILEYCVGGDLMSLLRQDVRLPESSVHDFGRDMVVALQFLHAHSIIYCDIKPSNILLDENGRLKLGGFGLSRRLADINKTPVTNLPPAKRGTPCYMAPELFSEGAPHSTASDLWSLGCVLYECATGSPPFMDASFNKLVRDILNKDPAPIPGASPEFSHLLCRLLDKNPATRIKWQELVEHPFWQARLPVLPLPPEPALETFISLHNLAAAGDDDAAGDQAVRSLRESVDLSRLSRIALSNLEKDDAAADYTAAQPATAGGDITIDSTDAELDFEEVQEQGGHDEDGGASGSGEADVGVDQLGRSATPGRAAGQPAVVECSEASDSSGVLGPAVQQQVASRTPGRPPGVACRHEAAGQQEASVKLLGLQHAQQEYCSAAAKQQPYSSSSSSAPASRQVPDSTHGEDVDAADSDTDLLSLIWHPTDSAVKPIVANRRIERLAEPSWDAASLPFAPLTLQGMLDCDQGELERFLTQVYRTIASSAAVKQKVNLLAYFESLCSDTAAANVLINSSLTVLFVRMLRNGKLPLLRIRLASVLGLLIRHATFIADELASTHVVQILTEALSDINERVRRRVMATLGELLFYVATQQQDSGAATVAGASEAWGITQETVAAVVHLLRPNEDEVCQHYAIKTIENICSQGGEWAGKFAQQDVLLGLMGVYNSTKTENVKATTASTISRLLRSNPKLLPVLLDKSGVQLILQGLCDSSSKVQVSSVNILNLVLSEPEYAAALAPSLQTEQGALLTALSGLLDHSLVLLRAKGLVTFMLLCRLSPSWLLTCCQHKLILLVERLTRDKDTHIQASISLLHAELANAVHAICAEIDDCLASTKQQQQPRAGGDSGVVLEQLFVILSLVTSPSFRSSVVSAELIESLSRYLLAAATAEQHDEQQALCDDTHMSGFRSTLMQVLEAVSQPENMSAFPGAFLRDLMPALCSTISSSGGDSGCSSGLSDMRFFCLRIMSDCLALYLTSTDMQEGPQCAVAGSHLLAGCALDTPSPAAALDMLLRRHVVPLVPVLLELEDPMPLYALKLLGGILDVNSSYVSVVDELELSQCFFDFLTLEHPNNNVHNIRLCRQLVLSGCITTTQLRQLQAADKVCAVLSYAQQNNVEPFLEPVLLLAHALIVHDTPAGKAGSQEGQLLGIFLTQLLAFTDLCSHAECAVALAAAQCLAQLVAACPADTAQGLLSSGGITLLTSALQASLADTEPGAAQLQQQLVSAINAALAADQGPSRPPGDLSQLVGALQALAESPDACVASAAAAAAERVSSVARVAC